MKYTKLLELITQMQTFEQVQWVKGYLAALCDHNLIQKKDHQTLRQHLNRKISELNSNL